MTCKDCIHSGLCYKENDYENFPDRCGDFISDKVLEERPQGEWLWLGDNPNPNHKWSCSKCGRGIKEQENFCPNCGAKMLKDKEGGLV